MRDAKCAMRNAQCEMRNAGRLGRGPVTDASTRGRLALPVPILAHAAVRNAHFAFGTC
jgi:hypothetical protein